MATVRDDQLRTYLGVFRDTYLDTANKTVPEEHGRLLLRYPLLSRKAVGYISTQFGAGFEYLSEPGPGIEIRRHSSRIEDLFLGAPPQLRKLTTAYRFRDSSVTLVQGEITDLYPFRLEGNTSLRVQDCRFRFRDTGWERAVEYAELHTDRSERFWSEQNAVARAKDEIYIALLGIHQSQARSVSLADYLSTFKEKHVLVLGDYSPDGKRRLDAIKAVLADLGYVPLLLDEVPENLYYDLRQKAAAISPVVRFVVAEDSTPSGHLVELRDVESHNWVTVLLRRKGASSTSLTRGVSEHSKEIVEREYDVNNLAEVLTDSVNWAEGRIEEAKTRFTLEYPWRSPGA